MLHCGKKLWRTFKPPAKHGALTSRSRPYLTFVPSPTGCGMKNSPRRGAGRNQHFSRDFHFGESKRIQLTCKQRDHQGQSQTPGCFRCSSAENKMLEILEVKETAGPLCHASWPVTREIPAGTVEKTTPALNYLKRTRGPQ